MTATLTNTFSSFTVAAESEPESMITVQAKAHIEAQLRLAQHQAQMMRASQPVEQVSGTEAWWNLYAFGPFQLDGSFGNWRSRPVLKSGETAYMTTILVLNDLLTLASGITAADALSCYRLPYEIRCQAGNLSACVPGPSSLNGVRCGSSFRLTPGLNFYVDVMSFSAELPGLYEMHVSARILGATRPLVNAPQFAGYARSISDLTPDLFLNSVPGLQYDLPIQFQVFK
jgi:hypothetical protein